MAVKIDAASAASHLRMINEKTPSNVSASKV